MSVPYYDPAPLWDLDKDQFNSWRANHDLPLIYEELRRRLRHFDEWALQYAIDSNAFCHVVPTASLLLGDTRKTLIKHADGRPHEGFYDCDPTPIERLSQRYVENGAAIPNMREILPFFLWAKTAHRDFRPVTSAIHNRDLATISFNQWTNLHQVGRSRAAILDQFEVLKLGGTTVRRIQQIAGKNLDFVDLDHLTVEDDLHGGWATSIQISSCRNLTLIDAELHALTIEYSAIHDWNISNTKLYDVHVGHCMLLNVSFTDCRLIKLRFEQCVGLIDFDKCDIIDASYTSVRHPSYSMLAEVHRRFRVAYQQSGKMREAGQAYFLEKSNERKALGSPYLEHRDEFPQMEYAGNLIHVWDQYFLTKEFTARESLLHVAQLLRFHLRVWTGASIFRALRYKVAYAVSLFEAIIWGYGERPGRILFSALGVIGFYSGMYLILQEELKSTSATNAVVRAVYFSAVTFTTLGYGDIVPDTERMQLICASEAFLGIFTMGLVVAGFANRTRY